MSAKMLWAVIVDGPTPDAGYYTLATFSTKERAELEKDKLEAAVVKTEKNTDSDIWGGWAVFPSRFYVHPVPAVIEDDEEFTVHSYFLAFSISRYNDDKTKIIREIDHVEYALTHDAFAGINEQDALKLKKLQEPGVKYVQWNTPVRYSDATIYETLAAFDITDIPLEVDVSEAML